MRPSGQAFLVLRVLIISLTLSVETLSIDFIMSLILVILGWYWYLNDAFFYWILDVSCLSYTTLIFYYVELWQNFIKVFFKCFRLISIAKASIAFSKLNLLNILQGICFLTYNIIPPPFPVRSSLHDTEYPGTQNWLTGNCQFLFQRLITHQYYLKPKRKVAQTYFWWS